MNISACFGGISESGRAQRSRHITVQFNGEFVAGDQVFVNIGGQAMRQVCIPKRIDCDHCASFRVLHQRELRRSLGARYG